jgi:hypothetical protein
MANLTPKPVRYEIPDKTPGPTASSREWSEWADSVNSAIRGLTFSQQDVLGNANINLDSSTAISDLSDDTPQNVGTSGDDHRHDGSVLKLSDLTAAAGNYDMNNNDITNAGLTSADEVYVGSAAAVVSAEPLAVTSSTDEYGIVNTDGTVILATYLDSDGAWIGTTSNHDLIIYTNGSLPQWVFKSGGALDANGNTITDFGGCTTTGLATLALKSNTSSAGGVIAAKHVWTPPTGSTANNQWLMALQYNRSDWESGVDRDVFKFGFSSADDCVMWMRPQGTGATDECHIVAGASASDGWIYNQVDTCGIRLAPNLNSGTTYLYAGGVGAMWLRKNTTTVNFEPGWKFANTGRFIMVAGETNYANGVYSFSRSNSTKMVSGHLAVFTDVIDSATAQQRYRKASIRWDGGILSGASARAGEAVPTDGYFMSHGWLEASTASDQTGTDVYIAPGPGTGDSDVKGDIILQTPDVGASGTTVQSLSTKAIIDREGLAHMELPHGEISVHDNTTDVTLTNATWIQITNFGTNGASNSGTTPDHTNDHITINSAGTYLVTVSTSFSNQGGAAISVQASVWKNNGATEYENLHFHRNLSAGTDVGSASISGLAVFAATDTVELWMRQDSGSDRDIEVSDCTLSVVKVSYD